MGPQRVGHNTAFPFSCCRNIKFEMLSRNRRLVDDWMYESGTERKGQNWMNLGVISIRQASKAMGLEITRERKRGEKKKKTED